MKLPFIIIRQSRWSELLQYSEKLSRQVQSLEDSVARLTKQLEECRRSVRELRWQIRHIEQRIHEFDNRKLDRKERRKR